MEKFKSLDKKQKTITILSILVSIMAVIFAVLQLLDIYPSASIIYIPMLGISNLCTCYLNWNTNKKTARINLFVAMIIFTCTIAICICHFSAH